MTTNGAENRLSKIASFFHDGSEISRESFLMSCAGMVSYAANVPSAAWLLALATAACRSKGAVSDEAAICLNDETLESMALTPGRKVPAL